VETGRDVATLPSPEVDKPRDVDGSATEVDGTETDVDGSATDVDGITPDVDGTATDVDGSAAEVDGSATDVDGINPDVDSRDTDVDGITPEVDGSATDVDGTETDVDGSLTEVDGTATDVDGTETDVDGIAPDVDGSATEVDGSVTEVGNDCVRPLVVTVIIVFGVEILVNCVIVLTGREVATLGVLVSPEGTILLVATLETVGALTEVCNVVGAFSVGVAIDVPVDSEGRVVAMFVLLRSELVPIDTIVFVADNNEEGTVGA